MRRVILTSLLLLATLPAHAEKIKYYQDPVYQRLNEGDPHPMDDLIGLAEDNDTRAQFILGDLYAKGKGGLSKNEKKGAYWFEQSAKGGYAPSFVRLAALAKHRHASIEAYKWYSLAIEQFSGRDEKYAAKAREDLVANEKMTKDDIRQAKKDISDWKVTKVKEDREINNAKKAEKEDALLEKPVKRTQKERSFNE